MTRDHGASLCFLEHLICDPNPAAAPWARCGTAIPSQNHQGELAFRFSGGDGHSAKRQPCCNEKVKTLTKPRDGVRGVASSRGKSALRGGRCQPAGGIAASSSVVSKLKCPVFLARDMSGLSYTTSSRRGCGKVGMPRLLRDFQAKWESRVLDFSTARLFPGLAGRQFRVEDRTAALVVATEGLRPIVEAEASVQVLMHGHACSPPGWLASAPPRSASGDSEC